MQQLDLLSAPVQRRGLMASADPAPIACGRRTESPTSHEVTDTSRRAYETVKPRLGAKQAQVLEVIRRAGDHGVTDEEISKALGWGINRVTPRRNELVKLGLVVDGGQERPNDSGSSATVWVCS